MLRTADMLPYVPYAGMLVKVTMTLSGPKIQSKDQFANDFGMMKAFRKSVASAINIAGIDSNAIVRKSRKSAGFSFYSSNTCMLNFESTCRLLSKYATRTDALT